VSNVRSAEVACRAMQGRGRTGDEEGGVCRASHLRIRRRSNRRCDRQRGGAWWPVILRDIPDGVPVVCEVLRGLEEALPRRRQRRVVFLDRRHACCCCAPPRCCKLLLGASAQQKGLTNERRATKLKFLGVGAYAAATPSRSCYVLRCVDGKRAGPGTRRPPKGCDMSARAAITDQQQNA